MDRQPTDILQPTSGSEFVHGLGPSMQLLKEMAFEIARTDIPVLIVGESGSGKDAYARHIHRLSLRNDLWFQKFNCASFDSAFLPHKKQRLESGSLPENPWGTLYLDNIQELDEAAQRILLSWLPDSDDDLARTQAVRIVSSAMPVLEREVECCHFRRELYFRLNGACLSIPPLRERLEDIPVLADYFLNKHAALLKKNPPQLNEPVIQALSAYPWPGNIRELENFARKAVVFGDFRIALQESRSSGCESAKQEVTAQSSSLKVAARAASKKAERELILQALERTHWNRKRAARDLQISYKSLLYKIKQIGVSSGKNES